MVDRDVEESLNLIGMEVHGNHPVNAGHTQQISHQFGTDAYTGLVLTVLAGPAEIRNNGVDALGRGAFGGINHQQQLHQVVGVGEGALNEEDVTTTDGLFIRYCELTVRELRHDQFAQRASQTLADTFCQVLGGST